jgi:hypothetical protein
MKVISLTSIPPRFPYLRATLDSLLRQGADEVRLYIPLAYRRFPQWDGVLPPVPEGVRICRCEVDHGPATKVLPACRDLAGRDVQILFCDDDGTFAPNWARRLFKLQAQRPREAVAAYVRPVSGYVPGKITPRNRPVAWQVPITWDLPYRLRRLMFQYLGMPHPWRRPFARGGYGDVFFGVGGVVIRPEFLDEVAFEVPVEAWAVDDLWLSAQLARRGIPIYCPRRHPMPKAQAQSGVAALLDMEDGGRDRQALNRAAAVYCQGRFGIWND